MTFEKVYEEYFSYVYLFVLKMSGNKEVAEDVTSDTFFKAMKSIDKFKGECELSVWLCQIAKNCYFSYLKKNKNLVSLTDETITGQANHNPNIEAMVIDKDMARIVNTYLHNMPDPYKEVFMWRLYAEMSFEQIGNMFGKNANWACVTFYRARKMLQERMEEHNE